MSLYKFDIRLILKKVNETTFFRDNVASSFSESLDKLETAFVPYDDEGISKIVMVRHTIGNDFIN
jgi:hypothetical protein